MTPSPTYLSKRLARRSRDKFIEEILERAEEFDDDDLRQNYLLLRLEGVPHSEAKRLSTKSRAQPLHSNSGQRGPVDAAGRRPITIAFIGEGEARSGSGLGTFEHLTSYTQDSRTDAERELDHLRSEIVAQAISHLNEYEREVIERMYGLNGHDPQTYPQIADALGKKRGAVANTGFRARQKIKTFMEAM